MFRPQPAARAFDIVCDHFAGHARCFFQLLNRFGRVITSISRARLGHACAGAAGRSGRHLFRRVHAAAAAVGEAARIMARSMPVPSAPCGSPVNCASPPSPLRFYLSERAGRAMAAIVGPIAQARSSWIAYCHRRWLVDFEANGAESHGPVITAYSRMPTPRSDMPFSARP